jgi:hypothetical protein
MSAKLTAFDLERCRSSICAGRSRIEMASMICPCVLPDIVEVSARRIIDEFLFGYVDAPAVFYFERQEPEGMGCC